MKKLFVALIVVVMTLSAGMSTVEAKRMGGGASFGKKSQSMNRQAAPAQNQAANAAKPAAAAAAPAAAAAAKPSMWKGMLGGALLGLGLGALLSSMGLGGAMAGMISNMIMIALFAFAAMFIYKLVRRKMGNGNNGMRPAFAASAPSSFTPEIASRIDQPMQRAAFDAAPAAVGAGADATGVGGWGVPADFDAVGFLRHSKTYFLRLQAAWDKADSNDIREFTTPEMFAELRMQLQERGAADNHTDVVTLDAELLGIETADTEYLASVKFTGMIKEDGAAVAAPFAEVWNLSKPSAGQGGWILAGIEQVEQNS
ncbi:Predicted lipid-binding transport protein, Tim44 family [Collimonas sp. OK242]|jgi:predicted lipid-binding transport protein (Tim44 family)|uniref:Tim44 domain-containing protein n=1 Tax=Collimonas sp. OK242 TaxID=1798195 RepID=UPI00089951FB|nr:Tim44-like domain-containing protein [Collimonas sp. OK242]SDX91404.1 Predicted lipid-binding transport protein, Tim44 family [Collimonas sp. OK242]